MSLRDKLEIRDTGFRMTEEPHQPIVDMSQERDHEAEWERAVDRMVFRTTLRVVTQWSANRAEYDSGLAQQHAAEAIAETLYGNVLGLLRRTRSAIYSRDWKTALRNLDEMEKEMEW